MEPEGGMSTTEEIVELLKFIGGFEKWPVLIEDCRREVVKYLDYESRFNLGICSKNDHKTVEKTKIGLESVSILDNESFLEEEPDNVTFRIRFPNENSIKWFFSQIGQDTRVRWYHDVPKQRPILKEVIWKSCDYYEEAVKFAEKWMKKSNFELKGITIEMGEYPFTTSQIKSLPCCKDVRICADDVDSFDWWLKKCPEQLDDLQLDEYSEDRKSLTLPSNFLNAPQIMQAPRFYFWCRVAFSDEQFLKLKAKSMHFDSVDVTDKGINKFIRNWVFGKAVDGFTNLCLRSTTVRNPDVMMAGLDEVKEWDEAFETEQWEFVKDFKRWFDGGQCYQIESKVNPFESLTLTIQEDRVSIYATEDCRREVVKYADYTSRCDLAVCSKNDLNTVKNTPIHVDKVDIEGCYMPGGHKVTVKIKINKTGHRNQEFTQDDSDSFSDSQKKAVKFAEKWIKKSKFKLNRIEIKMANYPFETSEIKSLSHCKRANFRIDDLNTLNWFIGKLPERLDRLEIQPFCSEFFTVPSNILSTPQIMQASTLFIVARAEFTDEQFLKLGAKVLWFDPVNVTVHGFKQYIENWMTGNGVPGFKLLRLKATMDWDLNAMMVELGAREWDGAFEAEAPDFVKVFRQKTRGQCFRIQSRCVPYESLTLNVDDTAVRVFATGFRGERDGEPCQDYKQPIFYW